MLFDISLNPGFRLVKHDDDKNKDPWPIVHIPGKPTFTPENQPTVEVFACEVEPKSANTLVRRLCKVAPLEDLRHVKRVRRRNLEEDDVQELVHSYSLSPFIKEVPKYAALSKEEWEEQCKLWPTSFHPPTYNIDGLGGFSDEDARSVCNSMKLATELAKSSGDMQVNAAVIVDPSVGQVVASATDQIHYGCVPGLHDAVACRNPWGWTSQPEDAKSRDLWNPLRHAAMVAIERSATRDREMFPTDQQQNLEAGGHSQSSPSDSPAKRQKTNSNNPNDAQIEDTEVLSLRPYLCTGYDIFLLYEPCAMCAMALVHQRIKRIFFAYPNAVAGALGSVHRLQGEKSLNHHYAVFRVILPDQMRTKPESAMSD